VPWGSYHFIELFIKKIYNKNREKSFVNFFIIHRKNLHSHPFLFIFTAQSNTLKTKFLIVFLVIAGYIAFPVE